MRKLILLTIVLFISLSVFVSSFNTSNIVACFNGSGMTDYYHHVGDLTNNGIQLATAGCKIGNECWNGSSVENANYINGQGGNQISFSFNLTSGTVMWWSKTRSILGSGIANTMWGGIDGVSCTTAGRFVSYIDPGANHIYMYIGNGANGDTGYVVPLNVWQHYAVRWNDSKFQFFVNGSVVYTLNSFNNWNSNDYRVTGSCGYEFFRFLNTYSGGEPYNGIIDEWSLWNRSLTNAEITESFSNSYSCSFPPINAISPNITLNINNTSPKIYQTINISSLVADDSSLASCWFYNNQSNTNSTAIAISGLNAQCSNLTKINLKRNNDILFTGYVTDSGGNMNFSNYVITVADTPPTSVLTFNHTNNDYTNSNESYGWTVATDADNDTISYIVWVNTTVPYIYTNTTNNSFVYNTTIQETLYYWVESYANGLSGGNSSLQKLTVDFVAPIITWHSPTSATTYTLNPTYLLNVTCIDDNYIWSMNISVFNSSGYNLYQRYAENISLASYNNFTTLNLNLYQKNTIMVRCYDTHTDGDISNLLATEKSSTELKFDDNKINAHLTMKTYFVDDRSINILTPITLTSKVNYATKDNKNVTTASATKIKYGSDFIVSSEKTRLVYELSSNVKLNYIPTSKFTGHFIWFPYVTDFASSDYVYVNGIKKLTVTKVNIIDDYTAKIIIGGLEEWRIGDSISIDPETQGLNVREENRTIYQMSYPYYTNLLNNNSGATYINGKINWSIEAQDKDIDENGLNYVVFWHNSSGFLDLEIKNASTTGRNFKFFNITTTITAPHYVCAFWNITDLQGLVNQSIYSCANITNSIPTIPVLSLPANNTVEYQNQTVFDWSNSVDADGDTITYNLVVSNETNLGYKKFNKTGISGSTYTLTAAQSLPDGRWYWAVNSTDNYGGESSLSNISNFIVNTSFGISTQTKNCTTCYANEDIMFNVTLNGATVLDSILFSENSTGSWLNYTNGFINSTDWYAYKVNGTNYQRFESIGWYWWLNSTYGMIAVGTVQIFNISNHVPTQSAPTINITNVDNLLISNLTCSPNIISDLDGDSILFSYVWYKNGINQSAYNNVQKLTAADTAEDDTWLCQVSIYDGYDYGIAQNSSSVYIYNGVPSNSNMFFYEDTNYSYVVSVPKYDYVYNFSVNVKAYNQSDICFQESVNQTILCKFYTTNGNGVTTYGVNSTSFPNNGSDGNHNTYIAGYDEPLKTYGMIEEYKVPKVPLILELDTGTDVSHCRKNISVPSSFVINSSFAINIVYLPFSISFNIFGYNGSWINLYNTASNPCGIGNTYLLYETAIYLNFTSGGLTNLSIATRDGIRLYKNYSVFIDNGEYLLDTNYSVLNQIISNGCTCTGCSIIGQNCSIPLYFHSDTIGRLSVLSQGLSSAHEFNDCTGSIYAILSNATMLNFTGKYEVNQSVASIDAAGTITYHLHGDTTETSVYPNVANVDSFVYCGYPSWAQFDIDYLLNYNKVGDTYTRQRSDSNLQINSLSSTIPLYVPSTDSTGIIRIRVTDTFNNPISSAVVSAQRSISGITYTIQTAVSDSSGMVYLYLDTLQIYTISASKTGYSTSSVTIQPTTFDIYNIQLSSQSSGGSSSNPVSISTGISWSFSPGNTELANGTDYTFMFNLTSYPMPITDCDLTLYSGALMLGTIAGSFNNSVCGASLLFNTGSYTNITSRGTYTINGTSTFQQRNYYPTSWVTGEFTMLTVLNDIKMFSGSGFNDKTRMLITFLIIFIIVGTASWKFNALVNPENILILIWALVLFFSLIGWLHMDSSIMEFRSFGTPGSSGYVDLADYAIFVLMTLVTAAYLLWRHS